MKKLSLVLSAVLLTVGLTGCAGEKAQSTEAKNDTQSKKEIVVGASPVPHKEILEKAAEVLKKDGYTLKIVDFTDYQIPNTALAEKQLDANYFQHIPFLNKSVEEKKLDLDYTVKVHIEPMGLYSKN